MGLTVHASLAGAEIKLSRPLEGKNPVVIGRLGRQPGVPTVTFYGHYDVQVFDPPAAVVLA